MESELHKAQLIRILQMAYSGERAAAFAYAGHWRAVSRKDERQDIARIEQEEWEHRTIVGRMLNELGSSPQTWRDLVMGTIGSVIFIACFVSGWFFPMYFAGKLEHSNVHEYEDAAAHAATLGLAEYEAELLRLSRIELSHEEYFKDRVRGHYLTPLMIRLFGWGPEEELLSRCPISIAVATRFRK